MSFNNKFKNKLLHSLIDKFIFKFERKNIAKSFFNWKIASHFFGEHV